MRWLLFLILFLPTFTTLFPQEIGHILQEADTLESHGATDAAIELLQNSEERSGANPQIEESL